MLRGILRLEFTMIASMVRLKTSQKYVFVVMVCKPVCICVLLSILFIGNLTHTPLDTNLGTLTHLLIPNGGRSAIQAKAHRLLCYSFIRDKF